MPIYEYQDTRTGRTWEEFKPIARRDDVPQGVRRLPVQTRIAFVEGLPNPGDVDTSTPKAIRDLECKLGTAEAERQMGQTRSTIKRAWNFQSTYRN